MILTRTPFRVSFLGGGSDIPWFYEEFGGGAVLSTAIDRHMYISGHDLFDSDDTLVKYSKTERVVAPEHLKHPIAREVLTRAGIRGIDISVTADIPAGTGLGSSSAFTVGLINLVRTYSSLAVDPDTLASEACKVELEYLKEPIGKQDQYATAFGGLNLIRFQDDGSVLVEPLNLGLEAMDWLSNAIVLVRLDQQTRSASAVLEGQKAASHLDSKVASALVDAREIAIAGALAIRSDVTKLGELVRASWDLKKLSHPTSNLEVADQLITHGLKHGAIGGKLLGAGGGGFVMFIVNPSQKRVLIESVGKVALIEPRIELLGSAIVYRKA
jgi:D-glycero-alpha-D-manno-heptose-7-phosphate kinase